MIKFNFFQFNSSFNNIVKFSVIISFIIITFYTSIIFFNLDFLKLVTASFLFLILLILLSLTFDKSYLKYESLNFKDFILVIITILYIFLFFVIIPASKVYFPTFPILMMDKDVFIHYDTAFHVSLINSIITFGYPSIGQHNVPFIFYHTLSHYLDAFIIFFSGLDALDSYGLFYYFKFISIFSAVLFFISQTLGRNQVIIYLISLGLLPQLVFGTFDIIISHSLWFTSIIIFFCFGKIISILKNDHNKINDYLFLFLLILLITFGKISHGFILAIFTILFLFFKKFQKKINISYLFLFILFFTFFLSCILILNIKKVDYLAQVFKVQKIFDLKFFVLVYFKIIILFFLNIFYKSTFIKLSFFSSIICALIVTFIKFFFIKNVSFYFAQGFDFIFTITIFYIFTQELKVKRTNMEYNLSEKNKNKLLFFFIFLVNKLSVSLLVFFLNLKKKSLSLLLLTFYFSVSNFYNYKHFSLLSLNPITDIYDKIIYYNNMPYAQTIEKNFIFENRSFNIFSIDEVSNLYSQYYPINYFLDGENKISFFRTLKLGRVNSNLIKKTLDGNFSKFKESLGHLINNNKYKKKDVLLFFPKETLERDFYNLNLLKLRNTKNYFGLYLYSLTGVPLIYGVNELNLFYGYNIYDRSSLSLYSHEIEMKEICKFRKDIIVVESFSVPKFSIKRCS